MSLVPALVQALFDFWHVVIEKKISRSAAALALDELDPSSLTHPLSEPAKLLAVGTWKLIYKEGVARLRPARLRMPALRYPKRDSKIGLADVWIA
ncbi:hypothetical protein ASF53_19560 [Methylobacterium sp. Leaf123]|uniref:hypothetical protein n=1 Tax=Methylobacterium sp. Leaf123 TaxID=1736264 RepID=UPI0006FE08EE|nr:hypothetical protein [Methylobacterium sp. Leaf123]KQQ29431.1 hypothetical protein ASF53_19560 [Methylobacterium sp. Leaf123]